MSVNGITANAVSVQSQYAYDSTKSAKGTDEKSALTSATGSEGVVYERSEETNAESTKKTYTQNTELVAKLKQENLARTQQLEDIVNKLISGQGKAFSMATGNLKDFFANLEVDEATRAQAQQDISEDGYYGVKQTSERIFDFAMALTGGDPEKMEEMRAAFDKGFKQATSAWGGDLPEISQKTRDAVHDLFDKYKESNGVTE